MPARSHFVNNVLEVMFYPNIGNQANCQDHSYLNLLHAKFVDTSMLHDPPANISKHRPA